MFTVLYIVSTCIGLVLLLRLYIRGGTKWCSSNICLVGKTTIVTGANTGIGYETALEFAKRGARVILGCRDELKAMEARDRIIRETSNKNVVVRIIDFSSFESVRQFSQNIIENEERLDILVNNAAAGMTKNTLTKDGLQLLHQINYFGPFLLTILLTDLLKKSAPSRIVNVSSMLAKLAQLDINNLNSFSGFYTYPNSKLCIILFTMQLGKILEKHSISVYSLHPGIIRTEIFRKFQGYQKLIVDFLKQFTFQTPIQGAQTTIHTAIHPGIESFSGRHFENCREVKPYKTTRDPDLPKKLWDKTVDLLKCEAEVQSLL